MNLSTMSSSYLDTLQLIEKLLKEEFTKQG